MVPNPAYHPGGDFVLEAGRLALDGAPRLTFGNIALYRTSLFGELPRGEKRNILPLYQDWIGRGWASGEIHTGRWANVGSPDELARLDRLLERRASLATPNMNDTDRTIDRQSAARFLRAAAL